MRASTILHKMSYLHESWLRPLVLSGDMLGSRAFVLLTVFNFVYQKSTAQIIDANGWQPMSHNDIYNQIRRTTHSTIKSTEYPVYLTIKPSMEHDNNLVQTQLNTKKDFRDFKDSFDVLNEKPFDTVTVADTADSNDQAKMDSKENTRKAKKVWNHNVDVGIDNILDLPKTVSTDQNINKTIIVINKETAIDNVIKATATSKSYEVTENSEKTIASEDNYTPDNEGYQYNAPTHGNQNLISTFYKILSKYNINSEDRLQNYDLSLQRKVQNPSSSAYRVPLPFGYNNLNHLPVDPLLAVFLSNYGFYLPSLYGIKANYNNLYGYLASNNIHNNKPFGLYKVFSDTDSWN